MRFGRCCTGSFFLGVAHFEFHGEWVWPIIFVLAAEIWLTLWDFVVEDNSRKLPASERVTLAINAGALFALYGWQLHNWHGQPTELLWQARGWLTWALTALGFAVLVSGIRDLFATLALSHFHEEPPSLSGGRSLSILVTGATGFVGSALVRRLLKAGHSVTVLTRDPLRAAFQFEGKVRAIRECKELHPNSVIDAVVHLAGASVIGLPWTSKRKRVLLDSRLRIAQSLLEWVNRASRRPAVWIQASAIGFYGPRWPDEVLTEESTPGTGFMPSCVRPSRSRADKQPPWDCESRICASGWCSAKGVHCLRWRCPSGWDLAAEWAPATRSGAGFI